MADTILSVALGAVAGLVMYYLSLDVVPSVAVGVLVAGVLKLTE